LFVLPRSPVLLSVSKFERYLRIEGLFASSRPSILRETEPVETYTQVQTCIIKLFVVGDTTA